MLYTKRAVQVQNVKVKEKITYAEAIRKVKTDNNNNRPRTAVTLPPVQSAHTCRNITKDTLIVEKKKFVAFMVEIVNCSAQTSSRTERIEIIAKAAEKYLDVDEMSVKLINAILTGNTESHTGLLESQSSVADSPW